jgi:hypothetical protein
MKHPYRNFAVVFVLLWSAFLSCQSQRSTIVFEQQGFPTIDNLPISDEILRAALPQAQFANARELEDALRNRNVTLLVMPYASAFPQEQWNAIKDFLLRGGNLLTLGGRPFTRPVSEQQQKWGVLPETYVYARQLFISDFQDTSGSINALSEVNSKEMAENIEQLAWNHAYSMVVRLSQQETSNRIGASGSFDAELKPLLWAVNHGHRVAAPVVELDHFQNEYSGGRWVMLNCSMNDAFLRDRKIISIIKVLAAKASEGAELLRVTPTYALYLPQENWQLNLEWKRFNIDSKPTKATVIVSLNGKQEAVSTINLDAQAYPIKKIITLPTNGQPGLHQVDFRVECDQPYCANYSTGFWVRDLKYLESGPLVTVGRNYFCINGENSVIIGTTYMASDVQRLYFRYPNPYIWDRDMAEISSAGVNMLRTGLWTDWDVVTDNTNKMSEKASRTIEAFLMSARHYNLPVQFTLFAFMPDVFGGENPYLDQEAVKRQREFVVSVVHPFAHVPFLMWDLINEPSFDNPKRFFSTHANNDTAETKAWNQWLLNRYDNRKTIMQKWQTDLLVGSVSAPADSDATAQSANDGGRPLAVYDFNLFAQLNFDAWAQQMKGAIRGAGSHQLITVGTDEGGSLISPSPNFFRHAIDFSTMHSWWFNDDLLWDSLTAKQQNMPMLVQETGVMTETNADGRPRRSPAEDGALFEKKVGLSLSTGAGAIEWLWNINSIMRSQQEVTIGAVRPDGTEKLEAKILRSYASFAKKLQKHLSDPAVASVAIVTSQAEQFSVLEPMATAAQHRAIRTLEYQCHTAGRIVAENHIEEITGSKLVILPSAQVLKDASWQLLMQYVQHGGNLLITGPVERDEHWRLRGRLAALDISASASSLNYRTTEIKLGTNSVEASFPIEVQRAVESLRFGNGESFIETKYGAGHLFIVGAPVELAESPNATTSIYQYVLSRVGIEPPFVSNELPSSILVRPTIFRDAVLYLMISESSQDQQINIYDKLSRAQISLLLPSLRTRMVLVDRTSGHLIATYNGPEKENQ